VLVARRHWVTAAGALLAPAALLLLVLLVDLRWNLPGVGLKLALTLLALGLAGLWTIAVWARWSSASITLTDQRLVLEQGILRRRTKVIALDRVQDVATSVSPLGRLLDYGRVEVAAAGLNSTEALDAVPSPLRLRDQIYLCARAQRGAHLGVPGPGLV